jgi:hypothetical protein
MRWILAGLLAAGVVALLIYSAHRGRPAPDDRNACAPPPTEAERLGDTIATRFPPPKGLSRAPFDGGSFAQWLRSVSLKPGIPPVHLFNGALKSNQDVHAAVLDIDVGDQDLQQCADAVIRLRSEYLWARGRRSEIRFNATSGDPMEYTRWKEGFRPVVERNHLTWSKSAPPDDSPRSFRAYLDTVFRYAGTRSLSQELRPRAWNGMEPGDVFIRGGSPGHAVIVVDVAVDGSTGRKCFLLAQSFMPAQEIHVLKNPLNASLSPWYEADGKDRLVTPQWTFQWQELKRFE